MGTSLLAVSNDFSACSCGGAGSGRRPSPAPAAFEQRGTGGAPGQEPPVWTWKAALRTALARAGSGWAAASATRTWTVRG